jgi:hypothetical protein
MQKTIKFTCQSTKQLKFETYLLNLPRTYAPHHPDRSLVDVWLQHPMGPQACSLSSDAHGNHAGVQQPAIGPQLRVDTDAVSLTVLVDVPPLTLTN